MVRNYFAILSMLKSSHQLMSTVILIILSMFVWAFYSGQQLLRQQTPLLDTIMQIRVDLAKTHVLIDEARQEIHNNINSTSVHVAAVQLKQESDDLYRGNAQMGSVHVVLPNISDLQQQLTALKESIDSLSTYIHANDENTLQSDVTTTELDRYFVNAEMQAEAFDRHVHHSIQQSMQRQQKLFNVLLAIAILCIGILLYLLHRSQKRSLISHAKVTWLSQALEHSGEAVIIANSHGEIEFVNTAFCQMTGYSSQEVLGKEPSILSSGKQNKSFYKNLWETILGGNIWCGELINRKKDGSLYPALMTIAPLANAQGELTHYVANQRDISDYKALEAQVFQAQKLEAIGALAGGIAHDFNNALASITGNIYLLKQSSCNQGETHARLTTMQDVCDAAAVHIKQLLSYARNDSMIVMDVVEINQCVRNACQMGKSIFPSEVNLKYTLSREELYVYWNAVQAQQVVINLMNNACHALRGIEQPTISIEVGLVNNHHVLTENGPEMRDGSYLCLSVQDNGIGMSEEVLEHIFEPFFTTKEVGEGTGLGLSMAYGAIKQVGGDLIVESQLGKGTECKIYLPIHVES